MALNEFQKELSKLEKKYGKGTQAYNDAVTAYTKQRFGSMDESLIPAGSTVTYRSPDGQRIEYTDPDGFKHVMQRNLDASLANFGEVSTSSNRPAVLSPLDRAGGKGLFDQLTEGLKTSSSQVGMRGLTSEESDYLDRIKSASDAQLEQQFQTNLADTVARLYSSGTNRSSIANQATADALQKQGLVQQQANSDDANRRLNLMQIATQLGQSQQNLNQNLLLGLSGQDVSAQTASAQTNIQQQQLDNAYKQFLEELKLSRDKYEQEQKKSPLGNILGGLLSTGLNLVAPGLGSAVGGIFSGATGTGGIFDSSGTYVGE